MVAYKIRKREKGALNYSDDDDNGKLCTMAAIVENLKLENGGGNRQLKGNSQLIGIYSKYADVYGMSAGS